MSTGKRMEGRKEGREGRELAGILQSDREERETTDRDGAWTEGRTDGPTAERHERNRGGGDADVVHSAPHSLPRRIP